MVASPAPLASPAPTPAPAPGIGPGEPAESFAAELERLVATLGTGPSLAPAMAAAGRRRLDAARRAVASGLDQGLGAHPGANATARMAAHMDEVVRGLFDLACRHLAPAGAVPTTGERLALVAIGGYGRGELAPWSDVDLLFLLAWKQTPRAEQVVEHVLYALWDLGLKVGQAVRSVDDCVRLARTDLTIRTTLLEARFLDGHAPLHTQLRRRLRREVLEGEGPAFVRGKLAERDARHKRVGDSRYLLEPNVKEGKGMLRDLQTLGWIARHVYGAETAEDLVARGVLRPDEARAFTRAHNLLSAVRVVLHDLTGRAEDRLTFDLQPEVARRLGYTDHRGTRAVERLMKHVFLVAKDVGDLTRILCAAIETEQRATLLGRAITALTARTVEGFLVGDGSRLTVAARDHFLRQPVDLLRIFRVAQRRGLDLHPYALRLIRRSLRLVGAGLRADPVANATFLEILTDRTSDPEPTLRRLSEAGVLGAFIPEFGRIVGQTQLDMYHHYTVDEHTLLAVGTLHRIERGDEAARMALATDLARQIDSRRALYVAMFCHDIAKGRGGDHSVLGEGVARALAVRLGLDDGEVETAAWLVRWHLLMSHTAFRLDLGDPETVRPFAEAVQSPERLRLLFVLTTADIDAVGPGRYTAWKGQLLADLYERALDHVTGGLVTGRVNRVAAARAAARACLPELTDAEFGAVADLAHESWWLAFDAETHAAHLRLVREAQADGRSLSIDFRDHGAGTTEVTIHTADHAGLFSRIAGAMAAAGASIVDARIFTLSDGMALDVFLIQPADRGDGFDRPGRRARLVTSITQVLAGDRNVQEEIARRPPPLPRRTEALSVPARVLISNGLSRTHTVIEVNGRDRPGLLYELTRALTRLNLQITFAKVSTYGAAAIDVFYVKDVFGLQVTSPQKLAQIRERLSGVLQPEPSDSGMFG